MRRDVHIVIGEQDPPVEGGMLAAICGRELRYAGFIWEPEPMGKVSDLREKHGLCGKCLAAIETTPKFLQSRYVAGAIDGELLVPRTERKAELLLPARERMESDGQ